MGAFPDCYERIAANFYDQDNEVSALVTCERAVSIFYGWGHPMHYHAKMMGKMRGRDKEAQDAARCAFAPPGNATATPVLAHIQARQPSLFGGQVRLWPAWKHQSAAPPPHIQARQMHRQRVQGGAGHAGVDGREDGAGDGSTPI